MRKEDAQIEVARLRKCAENMRECAWRASSGSDMRKEMAQADAVERMAKELEELYVDD